MNAINNNINFKGFYSIKNAKYSDKQNRVIDDIKTKLENRIDNGDYLVSPGAIKDTVDLQHFVCGFKTVGTGINKTHAYNRGTDKFIGSYDEEHPFQLEDLELVRWKNKRPKSDNTWKYIGWAIITLSAMLIGKGAYNKFINTNKENIIEKTSTQVKEPLTSNLKDKIKFFL